MENSWMNGYNKYKNSPEHQKIVFREIIEEVLQNLQSFSNVESLKSWYNKQGGIYCIQVAKKVAPNNSWAWNLSVILECACAMRCSEIYKREKVLSKKNGWRKIELD